MIRILRRAASDGTNAPAASETPGPGGRRSQRFEAAITGYVGRIAGADRADRLTRTVLAEVGDAEAAATVTRAARTAALGELERDARRPRARAERLADLHWRCAATPGLLRERLESEISKAGLDALYLHLDHCEHCAGIAARCDLAEWHLEAELAGPGPAAANGAGGYRPIRPGLPGAIGSPSPRPVGTPAGGGALAHWGRVEAPGAGPAGSGHGPRSGRGLRRRLAGAPRAGPAGSGHGPRSGRGLGRRLAGAPRGRLAAAAILAVIILVAAVALLGGGGGHAARSRTGLGAAGTGAAATPPVAVSPGAGPAPVSPAATPPGTPGSPAAAPPGTSSGVAPAASPATSATAAVHGLRDPFVVGQARYAVFVNPKQGWTGFVGTDAGPGRRWVAVTVRVRNLGTTGFDPRVLAYRVIDSRGASYAPDATVGTGPALGAPAHPLGPDELVETRLGFRVPGSAGALRLSFVPTPGAPAIVVGLGP